MSANAEGFDGPTQDFELTLGFVQGVRGFGQDELGRLTGVSHEEVYRPGINTAGCAKWTQTPPKDHSIADCSCGYHAYFDEEAKDRPYFYDAEVGAVVRGYGKTVIGTKGFRAEKSDLVALFPTREKTRPGFWRTFFGKIVLTGAFPASLVTVLLLWELLDLQFSSLLFGIVGTILGGLLIALGMWVRAKKRTAEEDTTGTFERLKKLYPGIPVYPSLKAAVAEHPLTPAEEFKPELPTPENDPDFWDRPVNIGRISSSSTFASGGYVTLGSGLTITGSAIYNGSGHSIANSLPGVQATRGGVVYGSGGSAPPTRSNPYTDMLEEASAIFDEDAENDPLMHFDIATNQWVDGLPAYDEWLTDRADADDDDD